MKSAGNAMLAPEDHPFPSSVELVLHCFGALVDTRGASALAIEAAGAAIAPAAGAAITSDLKCFRGWWAPDGLQYKQCQRRLKRWSTICAGLPKAPTHVRLPNPLR